MRYAEERMEGEMLAATTRCSRRRMGDTPPPPPPDTRSDERPVELDGQVWVRARVTMQWPPQR